MSFVVALVSLLIGVEAALASDTQYAKHEGKILSRVEVKGLSKTGVSVVIDELDVSVGKPLSSEDLSESFLRLFNLRIFSNIQFSLRSTSENTSSLTIHLKERWTLIPIAKVLGGGGTTQYTLGAYDINFLGSFIEVGAQYENLDGNGGFVHWFRNPRLFGKRVQLGYDIWGVTRNRLLYTSSVPEGEVAETIGGFSSKKERYNVFLDREFANWLTMGVGFDYTSYATGEEELSEELRQKNDDNGLSIPKDLAENSYYLYFKLGRLNYRNYLVEGFQSDWNLRFSNASTSGDRDSQIFTQSTKYFLLLAGEQNLGVNFETGYSTSENIQTQFFTGGLKNVRGFRDGQFVGKNYWQLNLEYRVSTLKLNRLTIQQNVFYDVGNTSDEFSKLLVDNQRDAFQSVGTGIRFISPEIFRLNLRIDIAKGLNYNKPLDISFGLQQFF